jgi:D-glycero-alpha-D-manno-heptose-7-phosphate kinase
MIIASTPLRISLFGGSTDTPAFIEKYGRGAVISFASSLKTFVTISQDRFGANSKFREYIVNYSRREEVDSIGEIQNDIVRLVLSRFNVDPITVSLSGDVFSHGSGLASSSSYVISLIKAVSSFIGTELTDSEICALAYDIELELNPYCGLQDPYGCGFGGFKLLEFAQGRRVRVEFLPTGLFDAYDCHLIFTGVTRESKRVLKDVSKSVDKSVPLLELVSLAYDALVDEKYESVLGYLNESWSEKKKTSSLITASPEISRLDAELAQHKQVLAHKLLGAGNGGFFLCFTEKGIAFSESVAGLGDQRGSVEVKISGEGIEGYRV